ncbi:MAG: sensor histidine kinase, partial [Limisphaerales bacterium]
LVGNAFAHLTGGRLEIVISLDPGGVATIRFEDDGPGLPEFAAGGGKTSGNPTANPGYGLGLSLVDRLCALHGWGIVKRPRPGGGTWIVVSLPSPTAG